MLLNLVSGIAVVGLTGWLLVTARVSTARFGWQYNLWALLVVLLWAQPWSRNDPFRTGRRLIRWIVYGVLVVAAFGFWYVFGGLWPVLVIIELIVLFLIEITGHPETIEE